MRRFLVGLTLLVFAATSPVGGLARGEPLNALLENYDRLIRPPPATEAEKERLRLEEENRQREAQNGQDLKRMLIEKRTALAHLGPTFEVTAIGGALSGSPLLAACLIGETGKVYMYDPKKDAAAQATGIVDERAFSKTADLAKAIGHLEWQPERRFYDMGVDVWTMSFDGRTTLLQIARDYVGALPDPRVGALVRLIDDWRPIAKEIRSQLELSEFKDRIRPPY